MTHALVDACREGLEPFFRSWYGDPDRPVAIDPGPEPEAIRRWWACADAWSVSLTHQNVLLGRDRLEVDAEVTIFAVENQAVVHWGYDATDDAAVFERNWGEAEWRPAAPTLESFLVAFAVLEATFGPNTLVADGVDDRERAQLLAGFDELPIGIWPGCGLWASASHLATTVPWQAHAAPNTAASRWTVMIAGRHRDDLAAVATRRAVWDFDSRVDQVS